MPTQISTRQKLINAAIELFATQGVTETTTKAVAELAQVNEVTLFRHFGNKHGLLLAVISESAVFQELGEILRQQAQQTHTTAQAIKWYASNRLTAIAQFPELVLSILGEAQQYPVENRRIIGKYINQISRDVAEYLATVMQREQLRSQLPVEKLASLLNYILLGYAIIELATETNELNDREEFLNDLVKLFLGENIVSTTSTENVIDLPANLVHAILQQAKKSGLRDYALVYVLFATGLSPLDITRLERSHQISDPHQHLLQITQGAVRQVPVNQWIMGKRYGSYTRNPLTQWLKSRKDNSSALFVNDSGMPITEQEIKARWQELTKELITPEGKVPVIEQAQQTWCVEMLVKGISIEDLSILTGWSSTKLQPYARRAKEKLALEQALRLDQKA
ncbi:TetR family transcriptional regulator [Chroococcidiopsis sp. TS-821]|uniref:TetR family transcriptional regulator n=1 Tax=Chroococcidiopsis sp. TS-821 TaxID=1378066 RepID=UPI000CEF3613|nr:TetR family transcriptional regulator [Chroococcidiopsis sp. TS-821]PPS39105.1 TetR family transcriptional regulator [Chroococcidiopsis sp. TS-821]